MPTKWLQQRQDGCKNDLGMPPRRAFCGSGSGFRAPGSGFQIPCFGLRVSCSVFRVSVSGFRDPGSRIRIEGLAHEAVAQRYKELRRSGVPHSDIPAKDVPTAYCLSNPLQGMLGNHGRSLGMVVCSNFDSNHVQVAIHVGRLRESPARATQTVADQKPEF